MLAGFFQRIHSFSSIHTAQPLLRIVQIRRKGSDSLVEYRSWQEQDYKIAPFDFAVAFAALVFFVFINVFY